MLRKNKNLKIEEIVKHLFHGSRQTKPDVIYGSEDDFDMRFSNSGAYGRGTYFADNSQYSSAYSYQSGNNEYQMFLALVLAGDSVTLNQGQYNLPPNKPGSITDRYDSINNGEGGHYILYDNNKSYPGFLITYK